MMDELPRFELDCSHDYSDEDFYGSSGKSFYESRDKEGKSKIHRHHPYDGRLALHSGEGETSVFFSQSVTASDVNFNIPKNEKPENSGMELVTSVQGHHLCDARWGLRSGGETSLSKNEEPENSGIE